MPQPTVDHQTDELTQTLETAGRYATERALGRATVLPPEGHQHRPEIMLEALRASGDTVPALFAALAKAQGEFGPIERTMTARVRSRKGEDSSYTYTYAPLDVVLAAVRPALSTNGIAVLQFPFTRKGAVVIRTRLGHASGEWLENDFVMVANTDTPQEIGSAIMYARRYALQALLGVSPDHDDDGAQASNQPSRQAPRTQVEPEAPREIEPRVLVTAVRKLKVEGKDAFGIKTTDGEYFTDDEHMAAQAKAAMQNERKLTLRAEIRQTKTQQKYRWLVEVE